MKIFERLKYLPILLFLLILHLRTANMAAVMSVDLGSEWMKVGVVSPGVPMEIALNKESKRKSPMFISFKDNVRLFGEDAQNLGLRYPTNSFGYLTDLIGKSIDNPVVELYKSRFPWHNIVGDEKRNTVVFKNGNETYSVEELLAQILEKAKEFAQDYTGQAVTETVIVVPGYFGQAERTGMMRVAQLANLKVLQLINDYSAVALNYGIFRRKEINETAQYFVFYDMGAYKTVATVVAYQTVKDKATREILPSLQVLGVAYDRTLGGLEMQIRLRDFLAKKFNEMKKTQTNVTTNPRAMMKLFKEAGRVKNILSANTDTFAQIEGLLEEHDFKVKVTREEFEQLCDDLLERVPNVLTKALEISELPIETINQVVLVGGNTRMPKVQETLKSKIKLDLAKNINADEAAAMGAVYRGADLATGFKVKKFLTKDAVLYPIQITFDRVGESGTVREVKRTLFGPMNAYPSKKVITFNKNTEDFHFDVKYDELNHLSEDEVKCLGSKVLSRVQLKKISEILQNNLAENVASKGIKAHFSLDDSGIFDLVNVELLMEKTVSPDDDQNAFQKISNTISKLFSGKDEESESGANPTEPEPQAEESKENNKTTNDTQDSSSNQTENQQSAGEQNKTEPLKIVTLKEQVPSEVSVLYVGPLDGEQYAASEKKINDLNKIEQEKKRFENAMNALESYVIDTQMKLDTEEYKSCASEEEIKNILDMCAKTSDWIYEDGMDADASMYEEKLEQLKSLANEIYAKHWEHNERPEALNALKSMINGSEGFLATAKNLTIDKNPDRGVFTQVEINNLEKVIKETIAWRDNEVKEQEKLARSDPVRLTVKMLTEKMSLLDREVKYLVNKIKLWKPKPAPKDKDEKNATKTEEEEAKPEAEQQHSENNTDNNKDETKTTTDDTSKVGESEQINDQSKEDIENHSEL
ncbi:hypoxia up-regulated protein 1 [Culicoides brevitarsis]|uniref:hypoxia up-regulated protein 1 n=1 Tax=Culicoides brevitarsis TaxID=469753 RepID=UPI00307C8FF1